MTCKDHQDKISLYMDDQLSVEEKKLFEAHLDTCEECREELEFMQNLMMSVHDLDEDRELPSGFHGSLMDKIDQLGTQQNSNTTRKLRHISRYYSAFAAAFIGIIIFGIIGITALERSKSVPDEAMPFTANEASEEAQKESSMEEPKAANKPKADHVVGNSDTEKSVENKSATITRESNSMKSESKPESAPAAEEYTATDKEDNNTLGINGSSMDGGEDNQLVEQEPQDYPDESEDAHVDGGKEANDAAKSVEFTADQSNRTADTASPEAPSSDSPVVTGIDQQSDDMAITYSEDINTKTTYGIVSEETKEDQVKEKHNQAYIIIGIFGLMMLSVGAIIVARRRKK